MNISELVFRHSKFEHKNAWFHKIIAVYNAATTICHNITIFATTKKILENEIIIHNFSDIVVRIFANLIDEYFKLWIDKEFANLSMKNWMKISLKSNWENKITNKVKIYFMNTKKRSYLITFLTNFMNKKSCLEQNNQFFSRFLVLLYDEISSKTRKIALLSTFVVLMRWFNQTHISYFFNSIF